MEPSVNKAKRMFFKVGDLGKATGISVRALHHYEEIGLFLPSTRNDGGHRVYSEKDVERLQQIISLKQLGLSLEDIGRCLSEKAPPLLETIRMHRQQVLERRDQLAQLYDQLLILERTLETGATPSVQELLKTIEVTTMFDKYFTKAQLEEIKTRRETLGDEQLKKYQSDWADLMAQVRKHTKAATDPSSREVQALAEKWNTLVKAFSGGNAHIEVKLGEMYRKEPTMREHAGMDPELYGYVGQMMGYYHKSKV